MHPEAGLGLYYYGARWYDPALGRFIQPDTIVPNPADAKSFDRFAYVNNNPLKYVDPSGHCPTRSNGKPYTGDSQHLEAADCWRYVRTILNLWDNTGYWNSRYTSKEVFSEMALTGLGSEFFKNELALYHQSDAYKSWDAQRNARIASSRLPASVQAPVDAYAVGIGINGDAPFVLPPILGFAGTGGIEVLAHKNGQIALYVYGGGGVSGGVGANASVYGQRIHNLKNAQEYAGVSVGGDATISLGLGWTGGQFTTPGGTYGEKVGFAPGANLSVSDTVVNYTSPIILYDSNSGSVSFPQIQQVIDKLRQ